MKRKIILLAFLTSYILISSLTSSTYAAKNPSYVGIKEGDVYTWEIKYDIDGGDEVVNNADYFINDLNDSLSQLDLDGYEIKKIKEIMNETFYAIGDIILPADWNSSSLYDVIRNTFLYYIEVLNETTIVNGSIAGDWISLNYSTFKEEIISDIDPNLPEGWGNWNLADVFEQVIYNVSLDLFINTTEITNTIDDIIAQLPDLGDLEDIFRQDVQNSLDILPMVLTIYAEIYINLTLHPDLAGKNVTAFFDELMLLINETVEKGIFQKNMSEIIDNFALMINSSIAPQYVANATDFLNFLLDQTIFIINGYYSYALPDNWDNMTIQEIITYYSSKLMPIWTNIVEMWDNFKEGLENYPIYPEKTYLQLEVNDIGEEIDFSTEYLDMMESYGLSYSTALIDAFPYGMMVTPINVIISMGINKVDLVEIYNSAYNYYGFPRNFIANPETQSDPYYAFSFAAGFNTYNLLLIANNYDTDITEFNLNIPVNSNPNAISISINYNTDGVLSLAELKSNGFVVASIELIEDDDKLDLLGIELLIFMAIGIAAGVGIVIYIVIVRRKKNRI